MQVISARRLAYYVLAVIISAMEAAAAPDPTLSFADGVRNAPPVSTSWKMLKAMKHVELISFCQNLSIQSDGRKDDLIHRACVELCISKSGVCGVPFNPQSRTVSSYDSNTKQQYKLLCLSVSLVGLVANGVLIYPLCLMDLVWGASKSTSLTLMTKPLTTKVSGRINHSVDGASAEVDM